MHRRARSARVLGEEHRVEPRLADAGPAGVPEARLVEPAVDVGDCRRTRRASGPSAWTITRRGVILPPELCGGGRLDGATENGGQRPPSHPRAASGFARSLVASLEHVAASGVAAVSVQASARRQGLCEEVPSSHGAAICPRAGTRRVTTMAPDPRATLLGCSVARRPVAVASAPRPSPRAWYRGLCPPPSPSLGFALPPGATSSSASRALFHIAAPDVVDLAVALRSLAVVATGRPRRRPRRSTDAHPGRRVAAPAPRTTSWCWRSRRGALRQPRGAGVGAGVNNSCDDVDVPPRLRRAWVGRARAHAASPSPTRLSAALRASARSSADRRPRRDGRRRRAPRRPVRLGRDLPPSSASSSPTGPPRSRPLPRRGRSSPKSLRRPPPLPRRSDASASRSVGTAAYRAGEVATLTPAPASARRGRCAPPCVARPPKATPCSPRRSRSAPRAWRARLHRDLRPRLRAIPVQVIPGNCHYLALWPRAGTPVGALSASSAGGDDIVVNRQLAAGQRL